MIAEQIAEIGVDPAGSLFVRPQERTFPLIHRAAMEVGWDAERRRLFSPPRRDRSYLQWFRHVLAAAAAEYGIDLIISSDTAWSGIPAALRKEIEAAEARKAAERHGGVASLADERGRGENEAWFRDLTLKQTLDEAANLWAQERYADYARILARHRDELSPAQLRRLGIAKRRAGLV